MPKLTPETQLARKHQIIEAALDCFATKGFANLSMADIIKASGLSAGSIYSHFKSKDEILSASADYAFSFLAETLKSSEGVVLSPRTVFLKITRQHPLRHRFGTMLQFFGEANADSPIRDIVIANVQIARETVQEIVTPWAALQDGDATENAVRAADQFMLVFHGYIVRTTVDPDVNQQSLIEAGAALLPA